jgi:hypothetical protein
LQKTNSKIKNEKEISKMREQNPENKRELNQDEMDQISGGRIVAMAPALNDSLNNNLNNNLNKILDENLDSSPSRFNLITADVKIKRKNKRRQDP